MRSEERGDKLLKRGWEGYKSEVNGKECIFMQSQDSET